MRLAWAIVAGILLGGGLAWWLSRGPAERPPADSRPVAPRIGEQPVPRLYRWRDERGVLQVTDRPPQGRPYEIVDIPADRNVVPPPADRD